MKKVVFLTSTLVGFLSLAFTPIVKAEIVVTPRSNGEVEVSPGNGGCTVLFNSRGNLINSGRSCTDRDISRSQKAVDSYLREQNASDNEENNPESRRSTDGDPEFWEVYGTANNNLGLKAQPSLNSAFRVTGLRNGTVLRNLGCENHRGDRWCNVEVRDNPRQQGWARTAYLREYSGSGYRRNSYSNSGSLQPGDAEVVNAGRNGIDLVSSPLTTNRINATGIGNGTQVQIQFCNDSGWCRVQMQDGSKKIGWIRDRNLRQY